MVDYLKSAPTLSSSPLIPMNVRALFQAAKVKEATPPYDTIHLKVFYPAQFSGGAQEQDLGLVAADAERSPFPIVIFLGGINCGPELYQGLAVRLAEQGVVVVTFAWVAENLPGVVGLTPGVDLAQWRPETYGTGPTASALPALLGTLERLQAEGTLAGLLDLNQVILGGHSAGGRVAIENANPQYFPQVVGAFAYGAHTAAPLQFGYAPDTLLPLPDALPLLLMGGTADGVIASSSHRYGVAWTDPTQPVRRTFQAAIQGGRQDSHLLIFQGANHFSIASGSDSTTARAFLDQPASPQESNLREAIAIATSWFVNSLRKDRSHPRIEVRQALGNHQNWIETYECR
jgi:dienelactone hydrolase